MKKNAAFSFLLCLAVAHNIQGQILSQREDLINTRRSDVISSRMIGGKNATDGLFPYQAGLLLNDGKRTYWCNGALISNEWVITVASCLYKIVRLIVFLGGIDHNKPALKVTVNKNSFIVHAAYDPKTHHNNIALIKLSYVRYTNVIKPIALPKRNTNIYIGSEVTVSGWGATSADSEKLSNMLQYEEFSVISNNDCMGYYKRIYDGHICVSTELEHAMCFGDAGDPMVLTHSPILVGLFEFRLDEECDSPEPNVFTRITYYLDWIHKFTGLPI